MPYNNAYNQTIAAQLQSLYANHIQHENAANNNTRQNDVMDPLEGMALRHEDVKGGSGTAAATLQDLGFEQMNGATGSGMEPLEIKPKRKYTRRTMKVAVPSAMDPEPTATAGGVSAGGVSAGGVSGGDDATAREVGGSAPRQKKPRKARAKGGGFLDTVKDIADTIGSVGKAVAPFAPLLMAAGAPAQEEGGAKKKRNNSRHEIVRQIMKDKGLSLIDASKHVKEHGLYKKGGALLSLASLDAMKPNQGPQTFESGGVPNSKLPDESKYTAAASSLPGMQAGKKPRKPRAKKQAAA
jgi:hypothetical protein